MIHELQEKLSPTKLNPHEKYFEMAIETIKRAGVEGLTPNSYSHPKRHFAVKLGTRVDIHVIKGLLSNQEVLSEKVG